MTERGERLHAAARRLGAHQTSRVLLGAAARGAGVALAVAAIAMLLDAAFGLPPAVRVVAVVAAALAGPAFLARAFLLRLPALRDLEEAARRTEAQSDALRERLVPALQVLRVRDDARTGYSPGLVDAVVDDAVEHAEAVEPVTFPYNATLRRDARLAVAGVVVAVGAVLVLGAAGTGRGLVRLAASFGELAPLPPASLTVAPGDVEIPRGEAVELAATVAHVRARDGRADATLQVRPDDSAPWRDIALDAPVSDAAGPDGKPVPTAGFAHRFDAVEESFDYRFAHAGFASAPHTVRAVPPPTLTIEEVRYVHPEYTGLPDRTVRDGAGDLAAVKGTVARLVVRSTNEPERASLALGSGDVLDLARRDDGLLEVALPILVEDTYRLSVVDTLGLANRNPLEYRIRALTDEAPFIRLLAPGADVELDEGMRVALRWSAVDDYGLGPVELVWEVSRREGQLERRTLATPPAGTTELGESFDWDVAALDLLPGDTVTYHLETRDNDAIGGPKTARTRDWVLRFPTLGEIYAQIDEAQGDDIGELEDFVEESKKVEERIEQLQRELLKQGESTWENRNEIERAIESQEKLAAELERMRTEIEENMQRLSESEFATLEAVQKMQRIQELMDEVMTREMRETLEKLREALEETNPRRQQDDLAEFRESHEELMEQLDRVMENLKQFRLDEKMKAAVRQAEELAARQERVNEELKQLAQGTDPERTEPGDEAKGEETKPGDEAQDGAKAEPGDESKSADEKAEAGDESKNADEKAESGDESPEGEKAQAGEETQSDEKAPPDPEAERERLAREEKRLAEEARRLEQTLKELAEMAKELRDPGTAQEMKELAEQTDRAEIPESMDSMSQEMEGGSVDEAQEKGEKALTELEKLAMSMGMTQSKMQQNFIRISQAAINRAVRDLLSLSDDEEALSSDLASIPRNSSSSTRAFADEQFLLIQGTERVESMLREVAKDTPLMDSAIGRRLGDGLDAMRGAADGLENGAIAMAREDGEKAVEEINGVVIDLLQAMKSVSSCSTGMPMSTMMQMLQEMSGDQQKLNEALRKLMEENGSSMDRRLESQLESMAQEQRRIREQLQQLLEEMGDGQGLLGRLDDVSGKLDEIADKIARGEIDEETLREQDWAVTRLLDAQRSIRERDFGKERRSETGEELADLPPPAALREGLESLDRDLREDLLKALERRYPPKYEELIKRYFRSLSDESAGPTPELP